MPARRNAAEFYDAKDKKPGGKREGVLRLRRVGTGGEEERWPARRPARRSSLRPDHLGRGDWPGGYGAAATARFPNVSLLNRGRQVSCPIKGSAGAGPELHGRLAQLVRALSSHGRGHRFESCAAHSGKSPLCSRFAAGRPERRDDVCTLRCTVSLAAVKKNGPSADAAVEGRSQTFRSALWLLLTARSEGLLMPREPKPWFRRQTGWWMVQLEGRQIKLVKGRANRKDALARYHALMAQQAANPPVASDQHTVASIIDRYLIFAEQKLAADTLALRTRYLQMFAESEGWRPLAACLPLHLEEWLSANEAHWSSDWTRKTVVAAVQRPFNWAVKTRIIVANPFRGVTHPEGDPRDPINQDQFRALLKAAGGRRGRSRPSPGARFRQIVMFLYLTGCRPGEAAQLKWSNVQLDRRRIVLKRHKTRAQLERAEATRDPPGRCCRRPATPHSSSPGAR